MQSAPSEQSDYISDRAKMYAEIPETKVLIKNYEVDRTMKTTKIYDNDSQCRAAGGRKSGADE